MTDNYADGNAERHPLSGDLSRFRGRDKFAAAVGTNRLTDGAGQCHGSGKVRRSGGRTECALCGATLFGITATAKIQKVIVGASGQENMRAIVVDGKEIHRCPALGPQTSASVHAV